MPKPYNMPDHYKGDTFDELQFTLSTSPSTPIDLTGALIKCQFRKEKKNGVLKKELTESDGITITDAINGVFRIDSFILDWTPGKYFYDIQFTFPDTTVVTYIDGSITILQDVTYG